VKLVSSEKELTRPQFAEKQKIAKSARLRQNYKFIPEKSFQTRKEYFINSNYGIFANVTEAIGMEAIGDLNMEDMMKKNLVMIGFQILMMTWVNVFFSGFVLSEFPHNLF
jgi:ER membrane protein complex subunit 3